MRDIFIGYLPRLKIPLSAAKKAISASEDHPVLTINPFLSIIYRWLDASAGSGISAPKSRSAAEWQRNLAGSDFRARKTILMIRQFMSVQIRPPQGRRAAL
jgi:hypothetical protein